VRRAECLLFSAGAVELAAFLSEQGRPGGPPY
jgi:hypothetical protein